MANENKISTQEGYKINTDLQGISAADKNEREVKNREILRVNSSLADALVKNGQIKNDERILVGKPLVSQDPGNTVFKREGSPTRQHTDMGKLAPYREKKINLVLSKDIGQLTETGNDLKRMAEILTTYLPLEFTRYYNETATVREKGVILDETLKLSKLITDYREKRIKIPTLENLGERTIEQNTHIYNYLRIILVDSLSQELNSPHVAEPDLLVFYKKGLCANVRNLAKHVSRGDEENELSMAYGKIGGIIDKLDYTESLALTSRLSTSLYGDLGFPALENTSNERLAEVVRNCKYAKHDVFKLTEEIFTRDDSGRLDFNEFFAILDTTNYGSNIIQHLCENVDSDSRHRLLREWKFYSGKDLTRFVNKDHNSYYDDEE